MVAANFDFLGAAFVFGFGFATDFAAFFIVLLTLARVGTFFGFFVSDVGELDGAGRFLELAACGLLLEVLAVDFLGVGDFCHLTVFLVVLLAFWVLSLLTACFLAEPFLAFGRRAPATCLAAGTRGKLIGAAAKDEKKGGRGVNCGNPKPLLVLHMVVGLSGGFGLPSNSMILSINSKSP